MTERRHSRRARLSLPCVLSPELGSPIWAETIDVGEGGLSVRAVRPLRADQELDFDLAPGEMHVEGTATVVRKHAPRVYGLRFESLDAAMRERLLELVGEARA